MREKISDNMYFKFALYSFLRRQQYFDPFIILAFLQKGLSFLEIGVLISIREITINLMEIPSGAMADVLGRKKTLILSLISYCVSFYLFGDSKHIYMLGAAMLFFGIGEAWRSGVHKSMMFTWLNNEGRKSEKKYLYGKTRAWGKIGAAFSIIPSGFAVFILKDFSVVFYISIIPYVINIINIASYPADFDSTRSSTDKSIRNILQVLYSSLIAAIRKSELRQIIIETMCYESLFKLTKDYIQPIIKTFALALPIFIIYGDIQRTVLLLGPIYFVMNLLSAYTSKKSGDYVHKFAHRAGIIIWFAEILLFLIALAGIYYNQLYLVVISFLIIQIKQNLWKPILSIRAAEAADETKTATILSIQSQAKAIMLSILAPFIGYLIDIVGKKPGTLYHFLPLTAIGIIISTLMILQLVKNKKII